MTDNPFFFSFAGVFLVVGLILLIAYVLEVENQLNYIYKLTGILRPNGWTLAYTLWRRGRLYVRWLWRQALIRLEVRLEHVLNAGGNLSIALMGHKVLFRCLIAVLVVIDKTCDILIALA